MTWCRPILSPRATTTAVWAVVVLLGGPAPLSAQSSASREPPRLSVAAGAGLVQPLHADLDFTAGLWEVSLRGRLSPRVAIEGGFGEWRHTRKRERRDVPLLGPTGPIGHAGRIAERTARTGRSFEVNMVALGRLGRVTAFGGGGAGALTMRRTFTADVSDCVSSVPQACSNSRSVFTSASLAFQGVGGIDVAVASRASVYGQFRFVAPTRDVGSSEIRVSVGARIAVVR